MMYWESSDQLNCLKQSEEGRHRVSCADVQYIVFCWQGQTRQQVKRVALFAGRRTVDCDLCLTGCDLSHLLHLEDAIDKM